MTPANKQLWILVGGNGAGKSTFFRLYLKPLGFPFINADVLARELYPEDPEGHSYEAARHADQMREDLLLEGGSFCFETVFSHPSKVDFLGRAKALGYQIIMVFVHVDLVDLNRARISQRVSEGGHHVPDDKVASRIPRTLENVKRAIPLCDQVRILDDSREDDPLRPVVTLVNGQLPEPAPELPDWLEDLLDR